MKTSSQKLIERIKRDFKIDIENVNRTYAGRNMKASGANIWTSNIVGSNMEVGSSHPISEILKANRIVLEKGWVFGQQEVVIPINQK